jgi:hypothetical protein
MSASRSKIAAWLGGGTFAVLAVVTFLPPFAASFVSDAFVLYAQALQQSLGDLVQLYVPSAADWYRPTTRVLFWVEAHMFGTGPIGYHAVALVLHLVSVALLAALALRITRSRGVAIVAAAVFLFLPAAHEPLWNVADIHTTLAAAIQLATLLAYVSGARRLAPVLAVVALTVDEAGLLTIALVALYEIVTGPVPRHRERVAQLVRGIGPYGVIAAVYVVARLVTGHITSEVAGLCFTPSCLIVGSAEYVNRVLVRPDLVVQHLWTSRFTIAAGTVVVALVIVILAQPWRWPSRRPAILALAWTAGACGFFVVTLWPYVTDRFVYVPSLGLALLVAIVASEAMSVVRRASGSARTASGFACGLLVVWFALGLPMLWTRGQAWIAAGDRASSILNDIRRLVPAPAPGSVLVVSGVPQMMEPAIPPGNTGAYLFVIGFPEAVLQTYGRDDISIVEAPGPATGTEPVYRITISGDSVSLEP